MSKYDKPLNEILMDYFLPSLKNKQTFYKQEFTNWLKKDYPGFADGTISNWLTKMSTNSLARLNWPIRKGKDDVLYKLNSSEFRPYNQNIDPPPIYLSAENEMTTKVSIAPNDTKIQVNVDDFIAFVRSRQGKTILTRKQKKGFTVKVTDKGFEFTPTETNTPRPHEQQAIARVINKFNETRSYTTSEYRDITYNASYTLTLIGLYLDFAPTADPGELEEKVQRLRKTLSATDCPEGQIQPKRNKTSIASYMRDPFVKAWVLEKANGVCESCGQIAPFVNSYGEPFLEVHHVILLAEGGSDTICNAIAVCPNCHRRHHYSNNKHSELMTLYKKVPRLKRPSKK